MADEAVERTWSIGHDELSFGAEVARGEFGSVFEGRFFGAKVAIKLIRAMKDGSPITKYVERELDIQSIVAHPNVVQFIGLSRSPSPANEVFVVTEWAARGDLQRYLYGDSTAAKNQVSWEQKIQFMLEIAQATAYLHSKRIVHRDIKCSNCLLTQGLVVKLCDFGLSRVLLKEDEVLPEIPAKKNGGPRKLGETSAASRLSMAGTDEWMAPEVSLGQQYGRRVDVFSFGITAWEIAVRAKPRARLPQEFFEFPEAEFRSRLASDAPNGLAELTIDCCALEPHKRLKSRRVMTRLQALFDDAFLEKPKAALLVSPSTSPRAPRLGGGSGARRQLPAVSAVVSISPL